MISQTVEYALRAIVTIAQFEGQPCTARKISEITQVPSAYLSKLMQELVRSGLVSSQRGLHGGFVLTKGPNELTFLDIVDAIEPFKRIQHCPLGIVTHDATLCPLHRRLDDVMKEAERSLRETTIAEVVSDPNNVTPLCEEQRAVMLDAGQGKRHAEVKSADHNADDSKKPRK